MDDKVKQKNFELKEQIACMKCERLCQTSAECGMQYNFYQQGFPIKILTANKHRELSNLIGL